MALPALVALLFFALPAMAVAQPVSPSDGIPLPDSSLATQTDSAAIEVNPAGLGYLEGFEGSYGFFSPSSDYQLVIPSGHALTFGAGGSLGGVGLGTQWIDDRRLGPDRFTFRKFTLSTALAPVSFFSVGGSVNLFSSRTDERLNDLRTVDMGLQFRPFRSVGFGLMARDVRPAFLDADRALPLRLGLGLAFRSMEGRLVVDNEVHHVQGEDRFEYRPRLAIEPIGGLRIFGHLSLGVPLLGREGHAEFDGMSVGMEMSFGQLGLQGATYFGHFGTSESSALTGVSGRTWIGAPTEKRSLMPERSYWVELALDDSLAEQAIADWFGPTTRSFLKKINTLDAIAEDPAVSGVVLQVGNLSLGYGQVWELHEALARLRETGKQSIAIIRAEAPTTRTVYAASAADEIWILPTMPYAPTGLSADLLSYAGLLDRLGVEAEFLRIGDYKSAPEALVRTEPSEPALEQTNQYLDAIYEELTSRIADRRGLESAEVRQIFDEVPIFPTDALERGLVDAVLYPDEMEERLRERLQPGLRSGYQRTELADERWGRKPEIAVVYIEGMITSGESGRTPFGGDTITGAETVRNILGRLEDDDNVKAVVLRIDSPGGSAVGSDMIYRSVRQLATKKPVIASMGNVAASGGYYAAAGADEIFASPVSLTGSIGIFTGKINLEALADRVGIGTHFERRGERAGAFSAWRPWSDSERQAIGDTLEYLYHLFLQQVARTRPLDAEQVDQVARGRVWTGAAAEKQQLVDSIGGITDALRRAEELAGLETGQALYTDRSGTTGALFSPGMATRFQRAALRLGLADPYPTKIPNGQILSGLEKLEGSLLWPLYFESGEPVFMLPYHLSYD